LADLRLQTFSGALHVSGINRVEGSCGCFAFWKNLGNEKKWIFGEKMNFIRKSTATAGRASQMKFLKFRQQL
jgi:hypothetical protein